MHMTLVLVLVDCILRHNLSSAEHDYEYEDEDDAVA